MKRFLILMLTLLLAAMPLTARSESDAILDKLLSDFFDGIYAEEVIYDDMLWAISYLEQYDQSRTWEDLQKARAAVYTVLDDISRMTLSEPLMTDDDYLELLVQGIDADFMQNAMASFKGTQTLMKNSCINLANDLRDEVFESHGWEIGVRSAQLVKEDINYRLQYLANTMDWLLLEIDDARYTESFTAFVEQYCPSIAARLNRGIDDQEAIKASTGALIEKMQDSLTKQSELVGQAEAELIRISDAFESGDIYSAISEIIVIEGMPLMLPFPSWDAFWSSNFYYYWDNEDETIRTAAVGDTLDTAPDGCVVTVTDVTKDMMNEYRDYLSNINVSYLSQKDEDGTLTLYYDLSDSQWAIKWKDDTATIYMLEKPFCFAPIWYILETMH